MTATPITTAEQLRSYLIGRIDNMLTGLLARWMSQQDKDVLLAERAAIVADDGTILEKILANMPQR